MFWVSTWMLTASAVTIFKCVFWPFSRGSNFSLVSLPPWSYSWPPLAWNPIVPFLPPFEVVPHLLWRRKRKSIVLRSLNSSFPEAMHTLISFFVDAFILTLSSCRFTMSIIDTTEWWSWKNCYFFVVLRTLPFSLFSRPCVIHEIFFSLPVPRTRVFGLGRFRWEIAEASISWLLKDNYRCNISRVSVCLKNRP